MSTFPPVAAPAPLDLTDDLANRVLDAAAQRLHLADSHDSDLMLSLRAAADAVAQVIDQPYALDSVTGAVVAVPVTAQIELALNILTIEGYRQPDQPFSILVDPAFGATRLTRDEVASVRSMLAASKQRWGLA